MRTLAAISLFCGIVLMFVSFFWPRMMHRYLVEKNTEEMVRAVDAMGVMHSGNATPEQKAHAREVHRVARGNVDARLRIREYGVWISRTVGIILTFVGVGLYMRIRDQAGQTLP